MKPKSIWGKIILNSRKEKTIEVSIKNEFGVFSASAPSGKSKGSNESKDYLGSVEEDLKKLSEISENLRKIDVSRFKDLVEIEKIARGRVGANTLYALEVALLKAAASEQGKELWQLLNENARKMPIPVGNCMGGGVHSQQEKRTEFQEFLVLPTSNNFSDNVFIMNKIHDEIGDILKEKKLKVKMNDEHAWSVPFSNNETLDLLSKIKDNVEIESGVKVEVGVDVAASTFYDKSDQTYKYRDKKLKKDEQIEYIISLKEKFDLSYIEDPLEENDFSGFSEIRKRTIGCLIVGDDLTVTHSERLKKALEHRSVNAIIVKPNQCGSLIEVSKVLKIARENGIKIIFSHRSGETLDYALADLAFSAQADYIKTGIKGVEREVKLKRLISIEKELFG